MKKPVELAPMTANRIVYKSETTMQVFLVQMGCTKERKTNIIQIFCYTKCYVNRCKKSN